MLEYPASAIPNRKLYYGKICTTHRPIGLKTIGKTLPDYLYCFINSIALAKKIQPNQHRFAALPAKKVAGHVLANLCVDKITLRNRSFAERHRQFGFFIILENICP